MANTLTGLVPTLYESLDIVSRELVGFIPACTMDARATRAALNQVIDVPITTPITLQNVVPGVTAPNDGDTSVLTAPVQITNSKYASVRFNGEEAVGLITAGTYQTILRDRFVQGFRALTNAVELSLFTAAYQGSSRATGTAGTTPFATATDMSPAANVRRILDDNGAPADDLHLVLGSAAVANLRGYQTILLKANENGSADFRRTGMISDVPLSGFSLHNSRQISATTKGTGAGYVTSGATAVDVNTLALITGTGTINAGDIVTVGSDSNQYVVNVGLSAPGTLTIGTPGVQVAEVSGSTVTVGASYTPNIALARSALILVARPPAMPVGPNGEAMDMADDVMEITDPLSGLTFQIAMYRQYKQIVYQVGLAWGSNVIKPDHIATLVG